MNCDDRNDQALINMAKKNDLAVQRLKTAYIGREGDLKTLSARFGVPYPSAMRYKKAGGWDDLRNAVEPIREAVLPAISSALAEELTTQLFAGNQIVALESAINALLKDINTAPVRSREGAVAALVKALDAYRVRKPATMMELAELAFQIPDFDPVEFAKCLRSLATRTA